MEFAIIAPIIIGLYLGLAEMGSVLSADRKLSHTASVAGDLATQVEALGKSEAADLVSAVAHVMDLDDNAGFAMRLQSFERDSGGTMKSEGVIEYKTDAYGRGLDTDAKDVSAFDTSGIGEDMVPRGGGIVVAQVRYQYKPFGFGSVGRDGARKGFLPDYLTLEDAFLFKPRRSDVVAFGKAGTDVTYSCRGEAGKVSCT